MRRRRLRPLLLFYSSHYGCHVPTRRTVSQLTAVSETRAVIMGDGAGYMNAEDGHSPGPTSESSSRGCLATAGLRGQGGVPFPGEVSPRLANTLRVLNAVGFLAVAVVNAASSRFLPNSIGEVSDDNGTPITPSGYAFSIWGLIYLFQGALFFVYQWMPCANRQLLFHRIGFWHLALCAFNIGWIFTFSYAELELSAAVIWAMLTCMTAIYLRIHTHYGSQLGPKAVREQRTWLEYLCVYVPWSLYTSWLLGASLINVFLAIGSPSEEMLYGGLAALAAAAFVNLMILAWTRDVWFAAVNVWALVAIADKQVALPAIWGAAVALAGVVGAAACVTWAANIWDLIARWRAAPPHKADGEHTQFVVSSKV